MRSLTGFTGLMDCRVYDTYARSVASGRVHNWRQAILVPVNCLKSRLSRFTSWLASTCLDHLVFLLRRMCTSVRSPLFANRFHDVTGNPDQIHPYRMRAWNQVISLFPS
jgi:hypothetical protein